MKKIRKPKHSFLKKKRSLKKGSKKMREINGPIGLEPTRYGDWERKGRCVDF